MTGWLRAAKPSRCAETMACASPKSQVHKNVWIRLLDSAARLLKMDMHLEWILSPFTQYGLIALGLMACLGFCISTSLRVRRERCRMASAQEILGQTVSALSTAVDALRREPREPETYNKVAPPGLNLTKRAQALRMHRRGEALPTIAAALQSPQNEIELLLKVQSYLN